jgi:magnesium chelatase family protein
MTTFTRRRNKTQPLTAHTVNSAVIDGIDGRLVEVQARGTELLDKPLPWTKAVTVAGMPAKDASDMLTRIAAALTVLGKDRSPMRIVLNIHPAGTGTGLDLPAAIAILQTIGHTPPCDPGDWLVFGSLDIHGEARHTPGALALSLAARNGQNILCPQSNAAQSRLSKAVRDVKIYATPDLQTAIEIIGGAVVSPVKGGRIRVDSAQQTPPDFADIIGQPAARRAAEIAAAGSHSILMCGTPGCGKSLIASAIAGITAPLTTAEKVDLTRIWGVAGMLRNDAQAVTRRPFRSVHHTATAQALIGGGAKATPGEVTLAHRGVLFLDELPEFRPAVLDSLRQPMEDGEVHVSRVNSKVTLPSRFSLIAAMNPCPCGYAPDCKCTPAVVKRYQGRISGPLMDRFDLKVMMDPPVLESEPTGESSVTIRTRVTAAAKRQQERYQGTGYQSNADVPGHRVHDLMPLDADCEATLHTLCTEAGLSMRGMHRIVKVARTIADLAGAADILEPHIREAASYV